LLVPVRAADKTAADKGQGGDDDISATELEPTTEDLTEQNGLDIASLKDNISK